MKFSISVRIIACIILCILLNVSANAKLVYVNVNNPTPGTGNSWATAYNDLNAAFAACEPDWGDTLWVAQGTYKPTTGTDRTVSFSPTWYCHAFGGFAGTETAFSQRDFRNHPTILSGDIGVPGDASDNSYHVLLFYYKNNGSSEFDGFTIQDGNANAGYPASSTATRDNQGGGVLLYGNASTFEWASYASMNNCTIRNNFAVYGGGFADYTIVGNLVTYSLLNNILFENNTSVLDGAAFYVRSVQGETVGQYINNCIFRNNVSSGGKASAIANYTDGTTGNMGTTVYYCTFYNNAAPLFTNQVQSGTTDVVDFWYCIMWNPSLYPDNTFTNGNGITYHFNDIGMATALATNVNYDPQFVDAAGGNLHLSPCSPAIDATSFYAPTTTDFDGNVRIQGGTGDFGVYESTKTLAAAPAVSNAYPGYCQGSTPTATNDLSSLVTSSYTQLYWYDASGNLLSAEPGPSTTMVGSTSYYVSQSTATACPGNKTRFYVSVVASPATPADPGLSYCVGTTPDNLAAKIVKDAPGNTLIWYSDATGTTVLSSTPVITTTADGPEYFYVSQKNTTCTSAIATITVNIGSPAAPVTNAPEPSYCQGAAADALDVTGTALKWYTGASGGTGVTYATNPTPSTASTGTQYYYISQTVGGCESDRTQIIVTVSALPAAPVTTDADPEYCEGEAAVALNITGTNLKWYTGASGGTGVTYAAVPTPSTAAAGTTYYYISQTLSGCESDRTAVKVTVNASPAAPVTTEPDPEYCEGVAAAALDVTGTALKWYTGASGGMGVTYATNPTPSTAGAGTQYYYISQTVGGCESGRTQITVTVDATPAAPAVSGPVTYCEGAAAADLSGSVTATAGAALKWYSNAAGGAALTQTPVPSTGTAGTHYYYVSQLLLCEGPRTAVEVDIKTSPAAPVLNIASYTYCQNMPATALSASGTDLQWYDNSGNALAADPTPSTAAAGTQYYYVSQTVSGCESDRSSVTVLVQTKLAPPVAKNVVYCQNDAATALSAAGTSLVWYTTATAGTGNTQAPVPVTTASGNTTYYVSQTYNGTCESDRTGITVTVRSLPVISVFVPDQVSCPGAYVSLAATGAVSYEWSPATNLSDAASGNPVALLTDNFTYTVTGTDASGCSGTAKAILIVGADCDAFPVPSAFTPNGDGHNDVFRIKSYSTPVAFSMQIFNRFGDRIFFSKNISEGWDGTWKGTQAGEGTYVYMITITSAENKVFNKKGTVVLMR